MSIKECEDSPKDDTCKAEKQGEHKARIKELRGEEGNVEHKEIQALLPK